jgi:hypothetical protein
MRKVERLEKALRAGDWFEATKATRVFADIAIGVGLAVSAGAAIYNTVEQSGIANKQLGIAQDQQYKQDQSFQQLQQLISNPNSFFSSPVYQASEQQGASAVARGNAAAFGPNSGNEAMGLQAYGQSFGQQQLYNQETLLAGMSGTGFNPSAATSAASSAVSSAAGSLNSLAGLMSFFGTSGIGGGGTGNPDNLGGSIAEAPPGSSLTYDSSGNITGSTPNQGPG